MAFRVWELALDLFAADYAARREHYIAAALPALPFPDRHFSLTVSGYALFFCPALFGFTEHLDGVLELLRVTSGEVRLHPLVDARGIPHPRMEQLRAAPHARVARTEVRRARGGYVRGGDTLLAVPRR